LICCCNRGSVGRIAADGMMLAAALLTTTAAVTAAATPAAPNATCCVWWPLPGNQTKDGCEAGGDAKHDGGAYHWNTGRGTPQAVCGKLNCQCCRTGPPGNTTTALCANHGKPPAPPPMNEPLAPGATVFEGGEAGYGWYFFPRLLQTPTGELLVFSEAHISCAHMADKGAIDIVLKRSSDNGHSWSGVELVHSEYKGSPGTWIGNPAPLIDAETGTLWLIMSRNNTDVLAMSSTNWGKTWGPAKVISDQVLAPAWKDTKPSWQGGWGWVATTGGMQLTIGAQKGRLVVTGDVQTPPTANCSSPYSQHQAQRRLVGLGLGDGKSCSQSWVMFSDTHGETWNYSRTLLEAGDEVSNPVQLANGSVVLNMRGHDLQSYDKGDPNNAHRWLGRSDTFGTTWPSDFSHMRPFMNASSGMPMTFGGDCFGDLTRLPAVAAATAGDWSAGGKEILVMGGIHSTGSHGGIGGRSDYRVHMSTDAGNSFSLVAEVYKGSTSYSGIRALNSTHVGLVFNAGSAHKSSMACDAVTKYIVLCVRCKHQVDRMIKTDDAGAADRDDDASAPVAATVIMADDEASLRTALYRIGRMTRAPGSARHTVHLRTMILLRSPLLISEEHTGFELARAPNASGPVGLGRSVRHHESDAFAPDESAVVRVQGAHDVVICGLSIGFMRPGERSDEASQQAPPPPPHAAALETHDAVSVHLTELRVIGGPFPQNRLVRDISTQSYFFYVTLLAQKPRGNHSHGIPPRRPKV
jgi:sialidase-1